MINRRSAIALSCALTLGAAIHLTARSAGEERGTRAEAKALADAALAHIAKVGLETAAKDFSADKAHWNVKDLYVVIFDFNGQCLAHGANEKLVGKQMLDIRDQNGRSFVKDFIASARKQPEGWVDFDWVHPQTKKPEPKTMNTRRVSGSDAVLVVGYYR